MPAPTYEEPWWRHPHRTRTRCTTCHKVVFTSAEHAQEHADRILSYGGPVMKVYRGKACEHWHLSRRAKRQSRRRFNRTS